MTRPRILSLDIETSPVLAYVWSLWKQNVGLNQIKEDWCILSFCAKWLGDDAIIYRDNSKQRNVEDDRRLLRSLWKLLDQADIVVAQNGVKFDRRKINARFLLNGMPPPSPYVMVDTMLEARKNFGLTSNKLEYMTAKLCTTKKLKHQKFPGFELWSQCLQRNPEAWAEMREYNIADVLSLEELYLILRPWIDGHPNVANYTEPDTPTCPKCGSANVIQKGYRHTQVGRYARFRCSDCAGWSRGRQMKNSKDQRKNLLVS
ncbi:RNase H superfamily protein [Bordetella genomosp. 9]|uniref:RNase H superfamily protein n=1 Tax=Bordetella genomosp. 9 TaxID=1416803 RepID=A0A261R4W7_9BORD|nr:RNase H superfamily protein [Bordetella genomosp. 9]